MRKLNYYFIYPSFFFLVNSIAWTKDTRLGIATLTLFGGLTDILICFALLLFSKQTEPISGILIIIEWLLFSFL